MQTPTHPDGDSHARIVSAVHPELLDLLQSYPQYNFTPLVELVTTLPPDGYEAFFNQVAELICRHMQDEEWDGKYLTRVLQELFRFRDAFRGMRGGESWA